MRIVAPVESESKFIDVERQVFSRDVVIAAHDAAFQQRPERFNRVRVNRAGHVLVLTVIDGLVNEAVAAQMAIAAMLIGSNQLRACRNRSRDEVRHRGETHFVNGPSR